MTTPTERATRLTSALRCAIAAALALTLGAWEPFRAADPDVEAGNRAYTEGRYDDALAAYDRASRRGAVDGDGLAFDRGTARLKKAESTKDAAEKQRLTERALEDLKQAGHARDPRIRGHAHYNRGNLLMGQDKLDDAIEAYKQALREQPDLDDARLNLELAMRRRHKQQQHARQQGQGQGQQGQGQGQQGQGGQGQQGQGSNQNGQNGQGSNQPPDGQSGQGSNQQNGQDSLGSNQPNGQNGQGSNQQNGQNAQGSNQPQNGRNGQGNNGPAPRGRPQRGRGPQSPKTPVDGKLDDLDTSSRSLQRNSIRRRATGRSTDPQHDW